MLIPCLGLRQNEFCCEEGGRDVMDWGLYDSCLCALCIVIVRGPIGLFCVWQRPPHRAGLDMCVAVHLIREPDLECKCL